MKICFIGPANSIHIVKWCTWFIDKGHEAHIISFLPGMIPGATVHQIDTKADPKGRDLGKARYLLHARQVKKLIRMIKPDVINAHYATSYGLVTALSGIRNYTLSVWGSDIYSFPKKSPLHRALLKYSLKKAKWLFSTSQAMADEASKYTDKQFEITPFGVDADLFSPLKRSEGERREFVVGTVKALADQYGIQYILEAVAEIKKQGDIPIQLRIAGKGPEEDHYRQMAQNLGIEDITTWLGFISQQEAAAEWANMDAGIIPSVHESFGVAAIEAQACGTPVVISDVPGLMEATRPGVTAMVTPRKDSHSIALAIRELYEDQDKRRRMGQAGVEFVKDTYELNACFRRIEELLEERRVSGS